MKHLKSAIIAISILALLVLGMLLEEMHFARGSLGSLESHYLEERLRTKGYVEDHFSQLAAKGLLFRDWFVSSEGYGQLTSRLVANNGQSVEDLVSNLLNGVDYSVSGLGFDAAYYQDSRGRMVALWGDEAFVTDEFHLPSGASEGVLGGGYAMAFPLMREEESQGELVLWVSIDHVIDALVGSQGYQILYLGQGDIGKIPFEQFYGLEEGDARRINSLIDEAIDSGRIEAFELNVHQLEDTAILTRIIPLGGMDPAETGHLVFLEEDPLFHYGISVGYRNSRILFLLEGILVISLLGSFFVYRKTDKIIHEDKLTRLYTRGYFKQYGRRAIESRTQNAAIILDIDNLKKVNEIHGLNEGDRVLETVGGIIKASIRPQDIPIRWSGEEFVIVLPGTSLEHGKTIAELIRIGIEDFPFQSFKVTASVGVFVYDDYEDILEFLNRMDENILITKASKGKKTLEISR